MRMHGTELEATLICAQLSVRHRRASQVQRRFLFANCMVGSTQLHSLNRPRRMDTKCSNKLDIIGVMEISHYLATLKEVQPFGIGVASAFL